MAETLPINFPVPAEAIASYNAIDASLGVGYANYYGQKGITNYFLHPVGFDSQTWRTNVSCNQNVATDILDVDFDMTFKTPQVIEGTALINASFGFLDDGGSYGGGRVNYLRLKYYIYHVSAAAVETLLASKTDATYRTKTSSTDYTYRELIDLAITKRSFSIGEKLRVNLILQGYNTAVGTEHFVGLLYHDGSNRQATTTGDGTLLSHDSNLMASMPYKINQ